MQVVDHEAYPNWNSTTPCVSAFHSLSGLISITRSEDCPNRRCESNANRSATQGQERGISLDDGKNWEGSLEKIITAHFQNFEAGPKCKSPACVKKYEKQPHLQPHLRGTKTITGFPDLLPITLNHYDEEKIETSEGVEVLHTKGGYFPEIPGFLNLKGLSQQPADAVDGGEYALYAVIAHMGDSNMGGHYKAVLKNAENQWIELSDRDIEELPFADKEKQLGKFPVPKAAKASWYTGRRKNRARWTPYILFYRLVTKDDKPQNPRKRNSASQASPEPVVSKTRVRRD